MNSAAPTGSSERSNDENIRDHIRTVGDMAFSVENGYDPTGCAGFVEQVCALGVPGGIGKQAVLSEREFETGTHVEVFGRNMGDWVWMGGSRGFKEMLHLYRHGGTGHWVMLPVPDLHVVVRDEMRLVDFDAMGALSRRLFLERANRLVKYRTTYSGLLLLVSKPLAAGARVSTPDIRDRTTGHIKALVRVPVEVLTEEERAEAMLAELGLPAI